ncbi:conjugal transfer protein TrbF [Allosphingosinicella indica]|uniref:Type IV secretion system protein VirB5 n=1 Tax=Allosphingosinicella indica TaxID=941907 RepID=A0A1X7FYN4_9SPHN|nr:conjugal transfer protein TrbF [Allosphingosinicella indica]SMF61205.1 type IV secretion system protein VirB5 [Allosphingosinicella indica]
MIFKRSVQRYGTTPEPATPYQRAGQLWDERIGSARVQARNWRLMAFGAMLLAMGLSAALVWSAGRSRVVPYVVAVDRLGAPIAVGPAEADHRPGDAEIAWHLSRFIEQVRTISLDPVLMRRDWLVAYAHATPRGGAFLTAHARSADPFAQVGERSVAVQVTSVVRASDRSFQVKWIENAFERGSPAGTSHWTALLTLELRPPRDAETLRKNPLGLYVDAIDWSRELEPPAPRPATSRARLPFRDAEGETSLPLGSPLDPELSRPTEELRP